MHLFPRNQPTTGEAGYSAPRPDSNRRANSNDGSNAPAPRSTRCTRCGTSRHIYQPCTQWSQDTIDPVLLGVTLIRGLVMGLDQQLSEYAANGRNTRITLEYILRLSKYKVLRGESVAGSVEFQDHIEQLIDYCTREGLWRAVRLLDAGGSS